MQKAIDLDADANMLVNVNRYVRDVLFSKTDDEEVYLHQRYLMKKMQWSMLTYQPYPFFLSLMVYGITRRLKKYSSLDILYFAVPYLGLQNGLFNLGAR